LQFDVLSCFATQGVDNVYTQHQPLLYDTIDNINKGRVHNAARRVWRV
jgi:hypothetical protein